MSGAPARPTDLRRFASIWNAAAPVGDTPGAAYLAGRGIDPHPSVRWLARSEWDAAGLQYDLAPTRASHGPDLGPGTEVAASHGYPADVAGVLVYGWTDPDVNLRAVELEGITHDGERRDYIRRNGQHAKRWAVTGSRFGAGGLFVVRPIRIGGRVHVCEGAPDALSLPALAAKGAAELRPGDAVIGVHGSRDLPKLAPLVGVHDTLIYPHMGDTHGDGERFSGELADAIGQRARIVRLPAGKGDLNSVLTGAVDAVPAAVSGASDRPPTLSGAEFLKRALQPDDVELVPDAPGLAYRGRAVLVHADRGEGKTTYSAFVTVRATRAGLRVLLAVDDDPRSWAARLVGFGADPELFRVAEMRDLAAPGALEREAAEHDVTLIDSWRRWLRASSRDAGKKGAANDESVVGAVADRFSEVAHTGPAVVMLTNQAKAPDAHTARGSIAIEDSVDAVREVVKVGDVTTIREAGKTRYGIPAGPWHMRLSGDGFTPSTDGGAGGGGGVSIVNGEAVSHRQQRMDEAITGYLMTHPEGASGAVVRKAITGNNTDIGARLKVHGERGADGLWRLPARLAAGGCSESPVLGDGNSPEQAVPATCSDPVPIGRNSPEQAVPESCSDRVYGEQGNSPEQAVPEGCSGTAEQEQDRPSANGGGDHPEGGIMQVAEQDHGEQTTTTTTTTTTTSEPTTEQSDRKPCAWTGRPKTAPAINLWNVPPVNNGGGGDMGAELEWSGAGAVLTGWRPGGPHALTLADIDAILCEDAKWYRETPGYPEAGETIMLSNAVAYWRTLTPAEREQERKRMLEGKRAAWRAVHVATMAQPYVDAHEACRAT